MKINIDGGYLEYETRGTGVPVLFVHGYPLSRQIWRPQLDGLQDRAQMIALDLRGHGDSYPFEGPYTMDLLAEDCHTLLKEHDISSPIFICGLSMGGYVTMALYRKYPQLFKAMILTSTRPGADSPEAKANRLASIRNAEQYGASYIAEGMLEKIVSPVTLTSKPELVAGINKIMSKTSVQGIVGALLGMLERPDSSETLAKVTCPVLIIHGIDDQLIPIKEAESMQQLIPGSQLVKIPAAGHLPCLEQPEIFNRAIRDFLTSIV
jgi:3-oxoadipate enol-lactonase